MTGRGERQPLWGGKVAEVLGGEDGAPRLRWGRREAHRPRALLGRHLPRGAAPRPRSRRGSAPPTPGGGRGAGVPRGREAAGLDARDDEEKKRKKKHLYFTRF